MAASEGGRGAETPQTVSPTMTTTQTEDCDGEGSTDTEHDSMSKAAATRREREGYTLEELENRESDERLHFSVGRVTPTNVRAEGSDNITDWQIAPQELINRTFRVEWEGEDLYIEIQAEGHSVRTGSYVCLEIDVARDLAELLFTTGKTGGETVKTTPSTSSHMSSEGAILKWVFNPPGETPTFRTSVGEDGATLEIQMHGGAGNMKQVTELSPAQARAVGTMLYQASEDVEAIAATPDSE